MNLNLLPLAFQTKEKDRSKGHRHKRHKQKVKEVGQFSDYSFLASLYLIVKKYAYALSESVSFYFLSNDDWLNPMLSESKWKIHRHGVGNYVWCLLLIFCISAHQVLLFLIFNVLRSCEISSFYVVTYLGLVSLWSMHI